jgi:hypothetical protein
MAASLMGFEYHQQHDERGNKSSSGEIIRWSCGYDRTILFTLINGLFYPGGAEVMAMGNIKKEG